MSAPEHNTPLGDGPWPPGMAADDTADADPGATITDPGIDIQMALGAELGIDLSADDTADVEPGATIADPGIDIQMELERSLLKELRGIREALGDIDVEAAYRSYGEEALNTSIDGFLDYLRTTDVIDRDTYLAAHGLGRIEATGLLKGARRQLPYEELGYVDEGGSGVIRVARDNLLRRKVALKRLKQSDDALKQRLFVKEAQITAQLDHPNIAPIYAIERDASGEVAFAMKLICGSTLKEVIDGAREGEPDERDDERALIERLELFAKICDAVDYAHNRGVVHRDLKPANIMVGKYGEVYVMDWGLALMIDPTAPPAPSGRRKTIAGTPFYMSPEQSADSEHPIGHRSDIFSLGLILFELCTLKRARPGDNFLDVLVAVREGTLRPMQHALGHFKISKDLKSIFAKATRLEPSERYASVAALAEDVRRYLRDEEVSARPDTPLRRLMRWMGKNRELTLLVLLGVILLSAAGSIWSLAERNALIEESKAREAWLSSWMIDITTHSADIDREFLRVEARMTELAQTVGLLLSNPAPGGSLRDWYDNLDLENRHPLDYTESPFYGSPLSLSYAHYKLAPGLTRNRVETLLRQLVPIRHTFREIAAESSGFGAGEETQEALWQRFAVEGTPMRWLYFGLEEGLHIGFPLTPGLPPDYDPRERPWYKEGRDAKGVRWNDPYRDALGQGEEVAIVSVVAPIYDADNTFRGVASMDITLDALIHSFAERASTRGLIEMFFLDEAGNIIARSGREDAFVFNEDDLIALEPYRVGAVVEGVKAGQSGIVEDGDTLIAYQPIPTLGWYYVEEMDPAVIFGD